jgi:hypothetical protein
MRREPSSRAARSGAHTAQRGGAFAGLEVAPSAQSAAREPQRDRPIRAGIDGQGDGGAAIPERNQERPTPIGSAPVGVDRRPMDQTRCQAIADEPWTAGEQKPNPIRGAGRTAAVDVANAVAEVI